MHSVRRYDCNGRLLEDTEPDMHAFFVHHTDHRDAIALLEQQVKAHLSIATARVAAADALYEAVTNCRFTTSELKLARLAYKEAAEPKHALAEPHGGDK